jgi:protein SCO1/2
MEFEMTRRSLLAGLVLTPVGIALAATKSLGAETVVPVGPKRSGGSGSNYFPDFVLQTHDGKNVRFYEDLLKGKVVLINFFYAKCEKFCPPQTMNLVKVQNLLGDRLGRDVFMYSLTLKPEVDTPEVLREYAQEHGAKPGWRFLTGKPEEIDILRRKLGFRDPDPIVDKDTSSHVGVVLYGNETRNMWSACPALTKPEEIIRYVGWVVDPANSAPIA